MKKTLALLLLCGALSNVGAQTPSDADIQALEQRFAALDVHAQQLLILERLPGAVGKRAEFDWLLSKLAEDLLRPEDSGSLARCLLRLEAIQFVTPGALMPGTRILDYSTPWTLAPKMEEFLVKDRAGFEQDYFRRLKLGQTMRGEEGVLREMVAWGRQHGTDPSLLSAVESEIAKAKAEAAHPAQGIDRGHV